ncbi:hypothetical protein L484_004202 [Morus notabilis]|uniref:Uncharacterized protein n=1 Tax=Morus notabilis TaxID=981085 RepID=W9R5J5_9ROSA|nr:hypothetical protein L484_004202 [Morus notabilis]
MYFTPYMGIRNGELLALSSGRGVGVNLFVTLIRALIKNSKFVAKHLHNLNNKNSSASSLVLAQSGNLLWT